MSDEPPFTSPRDVLAAMTERFVEHFDDAIARGARGITAQAMVGRDGRLFLFTVSAQEVRRDAPPPPESPAWKH